MSEVIIDRDENDVPKIHREGYSPVTWNEWIGETEGRISRLESAVARPHDHTVLADSINALVDRVKKVEGIINEVTLGAYADNESRPTPSGEIRISPDELYEKFVYFASYCREHGKTLENHSNFGILAQEIGDAIKDLSISPIQPTPARAELSALREATRWIYLPETPKVNEVQWSYSVQLAYKTIGCEYRGLQRVSRYYFDALKTNSWQWEYGNTTLSDMGYEAVAWHELLPLPLAEETK
jgi:hypothetical protein